MRSIFRKAHRTIQLKAVAWSRHAKFSATWTCWHQTWTICAKTVHFKYFNGMHWLFSASRVSQRPRLWYRLPCIQKYLQWAERTQTVCIHTNMLARAGSRQWETARNRRDERCNMRGKFRPWQRLIEFQGKEKWELPAPASVWCRRDPRQGNFRPSWGPVYGREKVQSHFVLCA